MKRNLIFAAVLVAAVLVISTAPLLAKGGAAPPMPPSVESPMVVAIPTTPVQAKPVLPAAQLSAFGQAKGLASLPGSKPAAGLNPAATLKGGPTCVNMNLSCGDTVSSTLSVTDCFLEDDGTLLDFWVFNGSIGDEVTINATSNDFDTFLFLLDPTPTLVTFDDDGGIGTNSRISFVLDVPGQWAIGVNNFEAVTGDPGDYTLALECQDASDLPPNPPSNLTATVLSSTEVDILWSDNSANEDDFEIQLAESGGNFQTIGTVSADSAGANISNLDPATEYTFRVRARNAVGNSDWSNQVSVTTVATGACVASATATCLNNGRFKVEIDWLDFNGGTGVGSVVPVNSDDSGLYYFFTPDNWELLIKVLDGCPINNHFWVFAAATTNVEYSLKVTDSQTGVIREYVNPLGQASVAITDTSAFATCP